MQTSIRILEVWLIRLYSTKEGETKIDQTHQNDQSTTRLQASPTQRLTITHT